ncbi:nuclear transport factor 2 family protein [Rhodococcus sp. T2V]|uniref:nuclear transport factor 2 family protein n=1 Tax=Rhodococcus sp. T2V TaxID=3034164 RepID=UPI0023E31128|nr:nuclear transport factor 2 family protein [Rhodococcus sp. T2V]MDF3306458.1 nuclear transport factor 2 family protein [Rhodococcus sp. T2V]
MSVPTEQALPAWGRRSGAIELTKATSARTLEQVADRLEITELISRYAWSYDERDLESLNSVFTPSATWEGKIADKVVIDPVVGRSSIVDWLEDHMKSQTDQRRHNGLNPLVVSYDGQTATVLTYLLLTSANGTSVSLTTTGFYRISALKQSSGGWLIDHLFAGFDAPF